MVLEKVKRVNDWGNIRVYVGKTLLEPHIIGVSRIKFLNGEIDTNVKIYWKYHKEVIHEQGHMYPDIITSRIPYIKFHALGMEIPIELDDTMEVEL